MDDKGRSIELVGDGGGGGDVEAKRDAGFGWGVRLGRADPEIDGSGGDGTGAVGCDDGKLAGRECEGDGFRGVCVKVNAMESDERANWGAVDVRVRGVELNDFIAGNGRSICHLGGSGPTDRRAHLFTEHVWL